MKRSTVCILALSLLTTFSLFAGVQTNLLPPGREYFEIRIYHLNNSDQEKRIDQYLKDALLPGLHRSGIKRIGVFKPIGNDTASDRRIFVLIPYVSLAGMETINEKIEGNKEYLSSAKEYINSAHSNAPYKRMEKIILKAFAGMPGIAAPDLSGPRAERVYELRSYEGATEKLYRTKVKMFNDGDEIGLFRRLGFNAIMYGEVLSGSVMPNLMYITSFENRQSRDAHWKAFGEDPQWKKLSALKEYENTVSKITIDFLYPTEYSDL